MNVKEVKLGLEDNLNAQLKYKKQQIQNQRVKTVHVTQKIVFIIPYAVVTEYTRYRRSNDICQEQGAK